jgi:hypothetical protein
MVGLVAPTVLGTEVGVPPGVVSRKMPEPPVDRL